MRFIENEIESESTCEHEDLEDAGRVQRLDDDFDCGLGGEGQEAGGETGEGEDGQARSDCTVGKAVLANMMPPTLVSLLVKLDSRAMEKMMMAAGGRWKRLATTISGSTAAGTGECWGSTSFTETVADLLSITSPAAYY